MTAPAPLIEFRNVSAVYGRARPRCGRWTAVDLTIERGEFVAIMGPSGRASRRR
jgi:putative ABC transport system ATP-binding protein